MARKKKQKLEIKRDEKPLLPYIMAGIVIVSLFLIIFSVNPTPQKTGVASTVADKQVQCLRQATDNSNMAVYDQDSCCFLIKNADRCRPAPKEIAYYRGRLGDYEGYLSYDYACFGGTTERVLFTSDVKYYCSV